MIRYDDNRRIFAIEGGTTCYLLGLDPDERVVHLYWGPAPRLGDTLPAISRDREFDPMKHNSNQQVRRDELVVFGDTVYHETGLKVVTPEVPVGEGELPHFPVRDLRLRYVSHTIGDDIATPGFAPTHGQPTLKNDPRPCLRIQMRDEVTAVSAMLCYRLDAAHDVIERWTELTNGNVATVTVEQFDSATVHLPRDATRLRSFSGAWAREFQQQDERLAPGLRTLQERGLSSGHASNPFVALSTPGESGEHVGTTYGIALAYSGNWRLACEVGHEGQVRVHAGPNPADATLTLPPGGTISTPPAVCCCADDGLGGLSRRLHRHTRERILPRKAANLEQISVRPVLYNSWEATEFDVTADNQLALAKRAAGLGVELFVIDDGWFGSRRHDRAGLGDWVVSPELFPDGMAAFAEQVRKLGMQFGLWVEPEMVNVDSDLYRAHPDWVLHIPSRPRVEARNQLILDFTRPQVVENIFGQLDKLVAETGLTFFKWDMNRYVTEPGSAVGGGVYRAHVAAVYDIMDRLRKNHPNLEIQSCSSGGGRTDLGVFGRCEQAWVSDNTCAIDRTAIQEGCSLVYPAETMEAWVTNTHNAISGHTASVPMMFDVAMRGVLGIGTDLTTLDDATAETYRNYIRFYKSIRHVVQGGDLHRLRTLAAGPQQVSIIQYVLPDASEAVYSLVAVDYPAHLAFGPVALRNLDPAADYDVRDIQNHTVQTLSGFDLLTRGLPMPHDLKSNTSFTRHLVRR